MLLKRLSTDTELDEEKIIKALLETIEQIDFDDVHFDMIDEDHAG